MHLKEVIILAGGLGTRLKAAVPELPKAMAPVLAKPFIGYLVDYLKVQGIERFIFSLGHKSNIIEQYLDTQYDEIKKIYSVEQEPLGTGGAILLALRHAKEKHVLIVNGDTFFKVDIAALSAFHKERDADCSIALKPMQHFDRYGMVELNDDHSVKGFNEKSYYSQGLVNGGVYALNVHRFQKESFPDRFSFEKDYMVALHHQRRMYGLIQDAYFIDIGIPADFEKAQTELIANM